mgnify:CR=1 FL=1
MNPAVFAYIARVELINGDPVSYTHLRAHETVLDLVCPLLLETKKCPIHAPFAPTENHHRDDAHAH